MDDYPLRGAYAILHILSGPSLAINEAEADNRPVAMDGARFFLSDDTWIERLDEETALHIQTACEPAQYRIDNVVHDRHLYAFLKKVPKVETVRYEGLNELHALVALSRLIHPTSTGDRYSAWALQYPQQNSSVVAIQYKGMSPDVLLSKGHRDWLSVADAEVVRKVAGWVAPNKSMHARVRRAYWNHEYAMRSAFLDMRWTLVVSGLEALTNIGERDSGGQFRCRAKLLADELQVNLSEDELERAWKLRSKLVHAEGFLYDLESVLPRNQHDPLYEKLEMLLRLVLRRSLLDENFGDFFKDDNAVALRWPYFPSRTPRKGRP